MKRKVSSTNLRFVLGLMLIVGLLAGALLSSPVWADSGLPPRDTPTPRPDDDKNKEGPPIGAHIELVATGAPAGAWAAVQWQDSAGGWHEVEGWRGAGGVQWAVSPSFNLPGQPNETLRVEVSLKP